MTAVTTWFPFLTSIIIFSFAGLVFRRYARRRGPHLLIWGLGLVMYGIASFGAAYYTAFGCGISLGPCWSRPG